MVEKIAKAEKYIAGAFLLAIIILGFIQVVCRGLGMPLAWSEETSLFCFLWFAYIGAAADTMEKKHIRVEMLLDKLPAKASKIIQILDNILWFVICVIIGRAGLKLVTFSITRHSLTIAAKLPYWVAMLSVFVGMVLMGIGVIANTVELLKTQEIKGGEES